MFNPGKYDIHTHNYIFSRLKVNLHIEQTVMIMSIYRMRLQLSWLGHWVLIVDSFPVFADFSGKERALKYSVYTLYTANALNTTLTTKKYERVIFPIFRICSLTFNFLEIILNLFQPSSPYNVRLMHHFSSPPPSPPFSFLSPNL